MLVSNSAARVAARAAALTALLAVCAAAGDDSKEGEGGAKSTDLLKEFEEKLETKMHSTFLFMVLVLLAASIAMEAWLEAKHVHWMPGSGATMLMGLVAGGSLQLLHNQDVEEILVFDEELFTLTLLPLIIFEAGFSLDKVRFLKSKGTIFSYAVFGTMVSTLIVGPGLYLLPLKEELQLSEAYAYGALISAVDPVATISIFGNMGVDPRTSMMVLGESIVNDAVSIVLYRTAVGYIKQKFVVSSIVVAMARMTWLFVGSIIIGIVTMLVATVVLRKVASEEASLQVSLLFMFSYMAYELAETFGLSGIVASLSGGMAAKRYAYSHMTLEAQALSKTSYHMIASMFETVVFFLIGLSAVADIAETSLGFVVATMLLCMLGRACNIVPISAVMNISRRPDRKITWKHQFVMWHAGLRGAIAYALALDFPSTNRQAIVACTSWVIFITVFVLGGSTPYVLDRLGFGGGRDEPAASSSTDDAVNAVTAKLQQSSAMAMWAKFENLFVEPGVNLEPQAHVGHGGGHGGGGGGGSGGGGGHGAPESEPAAENSTPSVASGSGSGVRQANAGAAVYDD